jgi:lipid II:glycine glycyltransferase (peptidoglycan interpeptide bridge formation enzyme)
VPQGWHTGQRQTYVLDLRGGEEALWKNLEQRGRSHVKKARKMGVVMESLTEQGAIDDFYPMLQATFRRQRAVSAHPKRFFLAMYNRLLPCATMEVLAARYEGRIIAMGLFVHDQHEIHFVSGASLAEYHHVYPNNLMHWHVIASSAQRGLTKYDFGGKGQPGIDKFKETFGPRVHAYATYWRASPPLTLARHLAVRAWPRVQEVRYHVQRILQPAAR